MKLRKIFNSFSNNTFIKSVSILASGTALSQLLMILIIPILTRLYSPSDFELFAVFTSIMTIMSTIACLRFDIAVPVPKRDSDSINLLFMACFFSLVTTIFIIIFTNIFDDIMLKYIEGYSPFAFKFLLAVGVMLTSLFSAFQFWYVRKERFSLIAKSRISQSVIASATQVTLGLMSFGKLGLLIGYTVSSLGGLIYYILDFSKKEKTNTNRITKKTLKSNFIEYQKYPKYSTFEALFNAAGTQLPILFIAILTIGPEAGFLALATRVMLAPMGLIGNSVNQVFLSAAPSKLRDDKLGQYTATIIGGLIKLGVGPLILAGTISPYFFPIIFGDEWVRAGVMVSWMTPWLIMQFITSPVSMSLNITGNQKKSSYLNCYGMILRVGTVISCIFIGSEYFVELFSISSFVFYMTFFIFVVKDTNMNKEDFNYIIKSSYKHVLFWVILSFFCGYAFDYYH